MLSPVTGIHLVFPQGSWTLPTCSRLNQGTELEVLHSQQTKIRHLRTRCDLSQAAAQTPISWHSLFQGWWFSLTVSIMKLFNEVTWKRLPNYVTVVFINVLRVKANKMAKSCVIEALGTEKCHWSLKKFFWNNYY